MESYPMTLHHSILPGTTCYEGSCKPSCQIPLTPSHPAFCRCAEISKYRPIALAIDAHLEALQTLKILHVLEFEN